VVAFQHRSETRLERANYQYIEMPHFNFQHT
jgi:hypothetical protein